jgi:phosphoglycerate dehydrogenase-like enzyme
MPFRKVVAATLLSAACFTTHAQNAVTDPGTALLANYAVRESALPVSEDPRWRKPRSLVVGLPSLVRIPIDDFENWLGSAAPGVSITFVTTREAFTEAAATADGALLGNCSWLDPETMQLRWVQAFTAGVERCLERPFDWTNKVMLTNARGMAGPYIAEHVITMALMLAHGMPAYYRNQREGSWGLTREIIETARPLGGGSLLVLGLGGIGSKVAEKAAALGMRVTATRNSSRTGPDYVDYVGLPNEMTALASKADVVVNTLPLTPRTSGVFDKAFFDAMKPTAHFINVGRGGSVVTDDLVAALDSGSIAGAGLDVTDPEPLPAGHRLWQMANVIITPHSSSVSGRGSRDMFVFFRENLRRYVAGEKMLNVVDAKLGY